MPAPTSCLLPEVDQALSPYINSRQDTQRIRGALSSFLSSHLHPTESAKSSTQYQHLDIECVQNVVTNSKHHPAAQGVRLNYLNAIRGKAQAHIRHRELQRSLEELRNDHFHQAPADTESSYNKEVVREYISLLRQHQRHSELQVIQRSGENLLCTTPISGRESCQSIVNDAIGEQPELPAERLELLAEGRENDDWIFALKRQVLEAKANMDREHSTKADAQNDSRGPTSLEEQVHALGLARDAMIMWMERELAKLNEESELLENSSPMKSRSQNAVIGKVSSSEHHVRQAYDRYTASRQLLVNAHKSIQNAPEVGNSALDIAQSKAHASSKPLTPTLPSKIITDVSQHLTSLAQVSINERALLQQAVYLQGQLASADENVGETLSKLSKESHLLPSGSAGLTSWGAMAAQASADTESVVLGQLQESHSEVQNVNIMLDLCSLRSQVLAFK